MIHHSYGCPCDASTCRRARNNQRGFDLFLATIFCGLFLAGVATIIRAGLFAWLTH